MAMDHKKNSELLKALGHPVRLQLVMGLLEHDGCNVNRMVGQLGLPQSTVSQHLALLRHAGIIEFRKEGKKNCYRITDKRVTALVRALKP